METSLLTNVHSSSVVALVGPTGAGKSDLALRMAELFEGEILSCDSVQIYRFFNVGTAKTPERERRGIPHHLIDALNPDEIFSAGDFCRAGRQILSEIVARSRMPIVTGGTGFYLRALVDGLTPGPGRNEKLRIRLAAREKRRPGALHRLLTRFDNQASARIHPNDVPKVIRALEIYLTACVPRTEIFSTGRDPIGGFRLLKLGLFPERDRLYERLEWRVENMFSGGLIEETAAILARGFAETSKPFESIGYKQALQVIKGELSPKDAIFYAKRDTRRYAKRQMTWFRREPAIEIIRGFGDDPEVTAEVEGRIRSFLNRTS